jgi:peptidyl-prolyl cis-trans isomerase C
VSGRGGWRLLGCSLVVLLVGCSGTYAPDPKAYDSSSTPPAPGASPDLSAPLPDPLPEVAARVNGHDIPMRNVKIMAEGSLPRELPDAARPRAYREALKRLIGRELLFEEALNRGLKADTSAVQQAYDEARVQHKDDQAWAAFLAQKLMDDQGFRAELRVRFTVEALMRAETAGIPPPTPQEVREEYDKNPQRYETGERLLASHILIRVGEGVGAARRAELRAKAEGLLAQIRKGADFAELARKYSEDEGSAGKGGRLQEFGHGELAPAFETAAYALSEGQVSEVVETPFGFHIIQLHKRIPSRKLSFEEVRGHIEQYLLSQKQAAALNGLVQSLEAKARIETFL